MCHFWENKFHSTISYWPSSFVSASFPRDTAITGRVASEGTFSAIVSSLFLLSRCTATFYLAIEVSIWISTLRKLTWNFLTRITLTNSNDNYYNDPSVMRVGLSFILHYKITSQCSQLCSFAAFFFFFPMNILAAHYDGLLPVILSKLVFSKYS